ncbi:LacI family DNA-binding transcriptional regulator [Hymenobacter sp. 102]|uniref:LacI family DNA-binding transcriptional regulator n=1 Tax=Hymenobacter sp. 102 TaxID=3403152 RepID=UPI003CEC7BF0
MPPRKKTTDAAPHSPVSMADLARELGVSMTTISRALSDHHSIGPEMKRKVQKLAKKYNYQPNRVASALRKGRSKLLGIIVPYIEGRFFPSVVHGIETAASRAGYNVIICQSHEDAEQEQRNVEALLSAQVAGILVSLSRTTRELTHFDKVQARGLPLVFFDRSPEGAAVNAVVLNDYEGAYQSTRHLLAQGCRRIAHLAGPQHLSIYRQRHQGYVAALRDAGLAPDEALICFSDMTQAEAAQAMRGWLALPQPPDAVFAAGDYAALGALQEAQAQGCRVPEEIAVAGFSNEAFTLITRPTLTTVDQRCNEMGQAAVQLLLELIEAAGTPFTPRQTVLPPQLLIRESSQREAAAPPASGRQANAAAR